MGYVRIVGDDLLTAAAVESTGALRVQVYGGSGASNIPIIGPLQNGATTLNAVTGNATGATVEWGGVVTTITLVAVGTGTLAGTLTIEGSLDGTTWVSTGATVALTAAATVTASSIDKAFRYFRASLSGASGTGTVTVKIAGGL